jgi:hypothetical protein
MSLTSVLRSGIAVAKSVTSSLQATVQVEPWIGQDGYGAAVFDAAVELPALVERKQKRIISKDGQEVLSRYYLAFLFPVTANGAAGRQEPIDPRDRVTLPDGDVVTILDVNGFIDADSGAPYLLEVWTS